MEKVAAQETAWLFRVAPLMMGGADEPAQSPAGHGVGFGEAVDGEGAFGHAGGGGDGEVGTAVEDQFLVNLVGNDKQVGFGGDGDDGG
jgi:hypothetical protein